MKALRTPDHHFANLPGYNFAPHYVEVDDTEGGTLRLHYVDEGDPSAAPVMLLHGEPSWSYLYRHMIPIFASAGHRVVAPDLIGFGRSDKPTEQSDYTYARHVAWMADWLQQIDLQNITLVCQDWGGLIGLRLVAQSPERFARAVVANTGLPTGDHPMGEAFKAWREYSQTAPDFDSGRIVNGGTTSTLTAEEIAAYNAPYPDATYLAGARRFPALVPDTPDNVEAPANRAAWKVLRGLETPFLTAFGSDDKITAGGDRVFQKLLPGAEGQPHTILKGGGHFLQEDVGPELAQVTLDFIGRT